MQLDLYKIVSALRTACQNIPFIVQIHYELVGEAFGADGVVPGRLSENSKVSVYFRGVPESFPF
jgi:hypothetical protein